jgi:hypothetical protein
MRGATEVAKEIRNLVASRPDLVQEIRGRKLATFPLYQIVGMMFRLTARVISTEEVVTASGGRGYKVIAGAYYAGSSEPVASAVAICTTDEPTWTLRPKYEWRAGKRVQVGEEPVPDQQRLSMATTRACRKALIIAIGWVIALAGFDVADLDEEDVRPEPAPKVRRKSEGISQEQAKLLWAAARRSGWTDDDVRSHLQEFGCEHTSDLSPEQYQALMEKISAPKS